MKKSLKFQKLNIFPYQGIHLFSSEIDLETVKLLKFDVNSHKGTSIKPKLFRLLTDVTTYVNTYMFMCIIIYLYIFCVYFRDVYFGKGNPNSIRFM